MTLEVGKVGTVTFTALVKGGFSDGSEINLSIDEYSLEWSTGSTDLESYEMSFDNGILSVDNSSQVGVYSVPIKATATSGDIIGTVENFTEVIEKFETVMTIETLDLSQTKIEEVKIPEDSSITNINLNWNTSVKDVDISGNKNLQTLYLTGSNFETVNAKGCKK